MDDDRECGSAVVTCHDCGAREGEIHHFGCDMERCPFCGGQLASCGCQYGSLGYDYWGLFSDHPTGGLPRDIYENGLGPAEEQRWLAILTARGRIPYIEYPVLCVRCGALWPDFFSVPDEEWERHVQPDMRQKVLCRPCYDHIVRAIAEAGNGDD